MRRLVLKISKKHWYDLGGFANAALFRKATSRGGWKYYVDMDHPSARGIVKAGGR